MMTLMVGVSGIRGIVGQTLTPAVALEFAQAYGTLLGGGRVVLARDSRPSGAMFEAAALAGLMSAGCDVTKLGIAMTPTIGFAIRAGKFKGGMSITASHNPSEWNGLKFLDDLGVAPDPQRAAEIAAIRARGEFRMQAASGAPADDPDAGKRHAVRVHAVRSVDVAQAFGGRLKVVLDAINGAGCVVTPGFLDELGCDAVILNGTPDGAFAHRPEPIAENLTGLCDAVRTHGAAIGFAQDPDADRLAIVDEQGAYIGEEYTLALAVWSMLKQRSGPVAANLSTSRMVDDIAREHGVAVHRTPVGESHVARAMLEHECVIGGEGNGGVIDPRVCYVRDSLSAISLVLQLMATTGKPVSELVAALPKYTQIKQKREMPREQIQKAVAAVTERFADRSPNTSDGVRVDFDAGWVHLRASNTEPIVRVIAEAADADAARRLADEVTAAAGL
jgi:phosphomannomutase